MWDILWWMLVVLYVPACIGLIIIVLLQKGKGAGFAGAFGIGPGSDTVFGPQTAQGLPVKMTYVMAGAFMTIALLISIISGRVGAGAAPELADETTITDAGSTATGLEDFGLGTGVTGQVDSNAISVDTEAPAAESAPVVVETTPSEAPTAMAPAETPEPAAAPAAEAPAVDSTPAPADTPAVEPAPQAQ